MTSVSREDISAQPELRRRQFGTSAGSRGAVQYRRPAADSAPEWMTGLPRGEAFVRTRGENWKLRVPLLAPVPRAELEDVAGHYGLALVLAELKGEAETREEGTEGDGRHGVRPKVAQGGRRCLGTGTDGESQEAIRPRNRRAQGTVPARNWARRWRWRTRRKRRAKMRWSAETSAVMTGTPWLVLAVAALGVCPAFSQERDVYSPFFDCPFINYFDSGCPELEREAGAGAGAAGSGAAGGGRRAGGRGRVGRGESGTAGAPVPEGKPGARHAGAVPGAADAAHA